MSKRTRGRQKTSFAKPRTPHPGGAPTKTTADDRPQVSDSLRQDGEGTLLAVGMPFIPGMTMWQPGFSYNYPGGTHMLLLIAERPTQQETMGFQWGRGPIELGFLVHNETIMMALQVHDAGLSGDAPFSIHLVPPQSRVLPPSYELGDMRALAHIMLVDASSGIIEAMRVGTMGNAFTVALHDAILKQEREGFSPDRHQANIRELYRRYPTTVSVMRAAVARTRLGD